MPEFAPEKPRTPESFEQRLSTIQLSHSIMALRDNAVTTPVWAAIMCALFGGLLPVLGTVSVYATWPWPVLCLVVAAAVFMLARHIKGAADDGKLEGAHWTFVVVGAHAAVTGSWCLVTLIFWEPGNAVNHCFLVAAAIAASSLYLTSRSGQFAMVVASTLPNLGMIWIHLTTGDLWIDQVLALVLATWAFQLHVEAWRACDTVSAAFRTRFEMEQLASELAHARDEAASANRAKSLFLANMSHELRTPLNAILGFAEIISTKALGKVSEEREHEYVGHITESGRHLLGLVNDVLNIARIDAGKLVLDKRWFDGSAVLKDCIAAYADQAKAGGLTLTGKTSPEDLRLFGDERAVRQIIGSLLSNAIKFTPRHGSIAARLALVDDGALLSIRDTGRGIPAEQLAAVFEPFEQAGGSYGQAKNGAGLGLTLVRSLTELHGGKCRIDSEVNTGTLVTVFLPKAQAGGAAAQNLRRIA